MVEWVKNINAMVYLLEKFLLGQTSCNHCHLEISSSLPFSCGTDCKKQQFCCCIFQGASNLDTMELPCCWHFWGLAVTIGENDNV